MGQQVGVKRNGVLAATKKALERIDKADTPMGQTALALAARLDDGAADTAMAGMAKELRTTMAELTRDTPAVGDPVDELRRRREARRRGA